MAVNLLIACAIAANPIQIAKFYNQWLEMWGSEYNPNHIWNTDECSVWDVPKPTSVVGVTSKRTFQTVSREKLLNTTIVSYVSAGGIAMPALVIFKAAKINQNSTKQHQ